jgi:hypothetical protein
LALSAWACLVHAEPPQAKAEPPKSDGKPSKQSAPKLGLVIDDPRAFRGYTMFAPLVSSTTYLMDMQGKVVRAWESDCSPGASAYFLDNGHLLRAGSLGAEAQPFGGGPGVGGRIQEFTWEGELIWDFQFVNAKQLQHHDITPLPNGNVLMIVWDRKTAKEALAAGRRPELTGDSHLLPDSLVEIKPTGKTTGAVVWEWHLWDHLVQDYDKSKANYGNVAEHPELVNVNYGEDALAPIAATKAGQDKLKSIGYVGANAGSGRPPRVNPDWTHSNGVSYNPDLDQIILSIHAFSEFWILDHSTTTAEAASHKGGRGGKGGDLLYRWGNPRAYRAGTKADQRLFSQHNAHWIPKGLPGAGHLLVFNNGSGRPGGNYSSVDELVLPVDSQGRYTREPGKAYGPHEPIWSYTAPKKSDFYSFFISGAQRLANGNTLICSGANGTFFEVTPEKETVWKYVNPVKSGMLDPGGFAAPRPAGQILSPIVRDILALSSGQRTQMDELQKEVDGCLDKLLTAEQKKQSKERTRRSGTSGITSSPRPGQIMTTAEQDRLKLADQQKKELTALQKDLDGKLDKLLTAEQKKQLKGTGGFPGGGPPPAPDDTIRPGQLVPSSFLDRLKMTGEQKKQLAEFQKQVDGTLDKVLTDAQKKQFKEPSASPAQPGQIMALAVQIRLKLTPEQRKQLQELQKEADGKLTKVFTDAQNKQFKELKTTFGRGGPGGPALPGGPGGLASLGGSPVFRAYRYAANHPGLVGRDLKPGKTVEEMQPKEEKKETSKQK